MNEILLEIVVILILIAFNAIFALSEIAVVSARSERLQQMAASGSRGAAVALEMARDPNRFLSTVQVGITLVSIFAGAFGGATIAAKLAALGRDIPLLSPYADSLALALIIGIITFLSVVLGELVPKRIALQNAEGIAAAVARPMELISRLAKPAVRLFSASTSALLALFRIEEPIEIEASEEDIKVMARQSAQAGIIEESEQYMVESIFRLGDRRLGALMTPRLGIVWLDVNESEERMRQTIEKTNHSRLPLCNADLDKVLGVVHTKDLLSRYLATGDLDLNSMIRQPIFAPESMSALKALEQFKTSGMHMAFVIDEYGGVEGIVTLIDILEAIVGDIPTMEEIAEPPIIEREDGSWLIEGLILISDFMEAFEIESLPGEGNYHTLGGFVTYMLGQVPVSGADFGWGGFRFEVMDMDGKRVDKVLFSTRE
jgi:putative hemolysin